jgi:4-diphosphocytidyl-2C-methyl-D-erythritol kinase
VEGKLSEGVLFNHFEEVYGQIEGEVAVLRRILLKNGTGRLLLAGSGSAWLGIFASLEEAREARRSLALAGSKGILTQTLTRKDYWDLTVPSVEKENRQ